MKKLSVVELYNLYVDGNKMAENELMKRCLKFVEGNVFRAHINCPNRKKDIAMDAISKVLMGIKKFKPNTEKSDLGFWGWVATISYNTLMEDRRFASKEKNRFVDADDEMEENVLFVSFNKNWVDAEIERETRMRVKREIKRLPVMQSVIVSLRTWKRHSYTEIAQLLNKKEDYVRSNYARAIATLGKNMVEDKWNRLDMAA